MNNFWKFFLAALLACLVAFGLFFFIMIGSLGAAVAGGSAKTAIVPPTSILKIDFSTPISERGQSSFSISSLSSLSNLSMEEGMPLLTAVRAIDAAANDPGVKFIYLNTDKMALSMSCAEELRQALTRFHESGKAIVAYANSYDNLSYYIASVADKVIINSYGEAMLNGVSTNLTFYKDLLDKLGVDIQLIRHGKYKSAGEQFTQNHLTDANREQNQELVNSIWATLAEEIAASRDFTADQLNGWIDNLELLDAQTLLDRGIVDQAWYKDELENYLCTLFDVKEAKDLKFADLNSDAIAKVIDNTKVKDKIAVLYADGEIVMDGNADQNIVGDDLARKFKKLQEDSTVKAIVFRVNSPGGSAQAAELINRAMLNAKAYKPVIASYGGYAASGGYWISSNADYIITDNTTLTGSIGVFSLVPNIGGGLDKTLHVKTASVGSHKHSDMMGGMRKLDDAEVAYMQKMVENIYTEFTSLVSRGRRMPVEQVDEIGQGRVWTGRDALTIGLADAKGSLMDAINYAAAKVGLEKYKITVVPEQKSMFEQMMSQFSGNNEEDGIAIKTGIKQVDQFLDVLDDPQMMYARMPYVYEF
ncbi:MAG: signal peptide peptidase SppA [Bacteroidales bacterium]|nr:signal peptide peptidase SppA [Bacteroidales bacterium]